MRNLKKIRLYFCACSTDKIMVLEVFLLTLNNGIKELLAERAVVPVAGNKWAKKNTQMQQN